MRTAHYIVILILLALACRTVARNDDYLSNRRYWVSAVQCSPYSPRSHLYLGNQYFMEGNIGQAIRQWRMTNRLNPGFYDCWANLGIAYEMIGQDGRALVCYKRSLKLKPRQADIRARYERLKWNRKPFRQ